MFDDYKVIVYIILAILYFLFNGKKKTPQKNTTPVNREEPTAIPPVSKPKTMLNQPKTVQQNPRPEYQPVPEPQPFSLEDILKEFGQTMEEKPKSKSQEMEKVNPEVLEQPVKKIVDYDEDIKEEIEDLETADNLTPRESVLKDEHFDPYGLKGRRYNKYGEMLKDPERAKTAFIAGEIFNRKYF